MKRILIYAFILNSFLYSQIIEAAPISYQGIIAFRDNEQGNSVLNSEDEDNLSLAVTGVSPDGNNGTVASARNSSTNDVINPLPNFASQNRASLFGIDIPFQQAQTDGNLTPWEITLNNGPDSLMVTTPDRSSAPKMGFVKSMTMKSSGTTATFSWVLPGSGPSVDRVYYNLWDDKSNLELVPRTQLNSLNATSVTINDLSLGSDYAIRITPEHRDGSGLVSRSSNWFSWKARKPLPTGIVVKIVAGSPTGIVQAINTPIEKFIIEFD